VEHYNHVNLGFLTSELTDWCTGAGLEVLSCTVSTVEKRTPNFSVICLSARKL
jgi:hypothetical protein